MLGLPGQLADLLALDLCELGLDAAAVEALPRYAAPLVNYGYAEMIGASYVLLGASLGGKVMARALAGGEHRDPELPVRFLTGIDAGHWTRFAGALDANLPDPA